MNINSKRPKPFCMEINCKMKAIVAIKMEDTGAVIRVCRKHLNQSFKPLQKA